MGERGASLRWHLQGALWNAETMPHAHQKVRGCDEVGGEGTTTPHPGPSPRPQHCQEVLLPFRDQRGPGILLEKEGRGTTSQE